MPSRTNAAFIRLTIRQARLTAQRFAKPRELERGNGVEQRLLLPYDRALILILSDINMPGMTGLELLPKAKAARPDVPVIMITAYGDDSTRRKALEGGAEALLTKPVDFVALRSEIDNRVAGAGAEVR